ncbi:MAG: dTMP kinase [Bacteroidales bacterium]|jgi:dTMP kinase
MSKGNFIVFEGIDGCGKSTQAKRLTQFLNDTGSQAWYTAQPTNSDIGKIIRQYINIDNDFEKDDEILYDTFDAQISYLFAADRHWHLYNPDGIINKLNSGIHVICDRYYFSTYAHNSGNLSYPNWHLNIDLNKRFLQPDLLFFLDTDLDICLNRIEDRGQKIKYESHDKLKTAQMIYRQEFQEYDTDWCINIDANQNEDLVFQQVLMGLLNVQF